MTKISDFKISEYLLKIFCKMGNTSFIDIPIVFTENLSCYNFNGLNIKKHDKLNKTYFDIISTYISFSDLILKNSATLSDDEKSNFLIFTASILRDLSYSKYSTTHGIKTGFLTKLNRNPFMWILFRDIICPSFNKPVSNAILLYGRRYDIDGALLLKDGINNISEPIIFSNLEIDNPYCREAFMFFELLKYFNLNPEAVIYDIFSKNEILEKFIGLLKINYIHTDGINDFLTTLCVLSSYPSQDEILIKESKNWISKAGILTYSQSTPFTQSEMWWHFGLIEKLLGPSRFPDWKVYFNMKPITEDLWARCEKERKNRGLKELPYEVLLRVQSDEFKQRSDLTIQGLLSDNRVW